MQEAGESPAALRKRLQFLESIILNGLSSTEGLSRANLNIKSTSDRTVKGDGYVSTKRRRSMAGDRIEGHDRIEEEDESESEEAKEDMQRDRSGIAAVGLKRKRDSKLSGKQTIKNSTKKRKLASDADLLLENDSTSSDEEAADRRKRRARRREGQRLEDKSKVKANHTSKASEDSDSDRLDRQAERQDSRRAKGREEARAQNSKEAANRSNMEVSSNLAINLNTVSNMLFNIESRMADEGSLSIWCAPVLSFLTFYL